MHQEIVVAQRVHSTVEVLLIPVVHSDPTVTPLARHDKKGKEVLDSVPNSRFALGRVDKDDLDNIDEQ